MTNASKQFLAGGGAPTAKFPNQAYGTVNGGRIIAEPVVEQQRDYDTGKPLTYEDGNPKLQMVVTIQTDLRDPSISDDDGKRRLFVRSGMRAAVQKAVQAAGVDYLAVGGDLQVTYTHDDGRAKQYTAVYTPPNESQSFLAGGQAPVVSTATGQPVVHQQTVQAAAPAAVAPAAPAGLPEGVTPEALKALQELGMLKQ
ncbi:hypothetical protein SEA_EDUGATOR_58 [Mycobacterium phage Edugator]|uniref:Uncharacterized protein n=4 Tax=Kratiovirus larva TaxID=1056831 RepID=A0A221J785_9CAUD|nr:hypothetical protein CL76_gp42 [Mycobacterium phage Larva]ASM62567.1 hypothetical protein SEA_ALLEYCAT_61 [Mycobacterium phage AlleyCat]ASR85755.1 hypothetical protein SEA_EDUGATOR_58 [Mycobacterium phage Edugator]QQV92662.1 hypothetical protein SEA_PSYCHO_59 [Mycobacterium phage Psycho]WAB09742.1 hypothetical protein SEA_DADOSKY_61 [Mycobacterium phage Dadosky]AEL19708.1 hypothetical protein LARVA_60 [Mycobacterium phage Larva]